MDEVCTKDGLFSLCQAKIEDHKQYSKDAYDRLL